MIWSDYHPAGLRPLHHPLLLPMACSLPPLAAPRGPPLGPQPKATSQPLAVRRQSDFSIEHILRDAGRRVSPCTSLGQRTLGQPGGQPAGQPVAEPVHQATPQPEAEGPFEWLHCTRYRPPKLPREYRRASCCQCRGRDVAASLALLSFA